VQAERQSIRPDEAAGWTSRSEMKKRLHTGKSIGNSIQIRRGGHAMQIGNKVAWFGSDSKTSFGKVRLKHRELFFSREAERNSIETVEKAYSAVRQTIAVMMSGGTKAKRKLDQAMQTYFKCDNTLKVMATLELVQNGMKGGYSLKTSNTSFSRNVNFFGDKPDEVDLTEGYVRGGNIGDIHVRRDYIMNNRFQAVRALIHEATHKFADTEDFGEKGYIYADGSDFREQGITYDECLINADSYAYFCMALGYRA
jgi:hypothetical protein